MMKVLMINSVCGIRSTGILQSDRNFNSNETIKASAVVGGNI